MCGRSDLKLPVGHFVKARRAAPCLCPREAGVCVRQAMGLEESRREGRRWEVKPHSRRLSRREPAQPVHRDAGVRGRAQRTDTGRSLLLRASALKSPPSWESFLTQRKQSGGDAEGAGLGATAPTTETGEAGNRLRRLARRPLPVPASKLAAGKDTPRQPCGFPDPPDTKTRLRRDTKAPRNKA